MASLFWTNGQDTLSLSSQEQFGFGLEAQPGATGFGLAPVSVQATEGAGDGSVYRSSRTLTRDFDIPFDIKGRTPAELDEYLSRMAKMFVGPFIMGLVDRLGRTWTIPVVRVGGAEHTLGAEESTQNALQTVVTLRAHDPYWTSDATVNMTIGVTTAAADVFVPNFMKMPMQSSQAIGTLQVNNTGDAKAYPKWTAFGPGTGFTLTSPTGETTQWNGTLAAGQWVTIDMRAGTVIDHAGSNRYALLAPSPRFWALAPGLSTVTAELVGADPGAGSRVTLAFQPRRWMVI